MSELFPTRQVVPDPGLRFRTAIQGGELASATAANQRLDSLNFMRFVAGLDTQPRFMAREEVRSLGDVFTTRLLLAGIVPTTMRELDQAIAELAEPALPVRNMFLVAEGGQSPTQLLNDRLVFTWQADNASPPDLMVSTVASADDPGSLMQLISWSETDGSFHYFERQRDSSVWAWAGNSFHALEAPTRGKGPFDSHVNGSLVMKELKAPWAHWHSMSASIDRGRFSPSSQFNTDPIFSKLSGAELLENIVRTGIRRWTRRRFSTFGMNNELNHADQMLRQVLWATSVNLVSAPESFGSNTSSVFHLPATFFYDAEGIDFAARQINRQARVLPSKPLLVDSDAYRAAIAAANLSVSNEAAQQVPGDTHFAFLVPERAAEDQEVLKELVRQQALSPKLALALLMVDFSNPVFSPSRAALLRYMPTRVITGGHGADLERQVIA